MLESISRRFQKEPTWTLAQTFDSLNEIHTRSVYYPQVLERNLPLHAHFQRKGSIWYPNFPLPGYEAHAVRYADQIEDEETAQKVQGILDNFSNVYNMKAAALANIYQGHFKDNGLDSRVDCATPSPHDQTNPRSFYLTVTPNIKPDTGSWPAEVVIAHFPWVDHKALLRFPPGFQPQEINQVAFDINMTQIGGDFYKVDVPILRRYQNHTPKDFVLNSYRYIFRNFEPSDNFNPRAMQPMPESQRLMSDLLEARV